MRLLDLDSIPARAVPSFGSTGFTIGGVGPQGVIAGHAVATLTTDGVIGMHEAIAQQVLVVLRGGVECHGDGDPVRLGPAQAIVFDAGEQHETRALLDSLLLIVEGDLELVV